MKNQIEAEFMAFVRPYYESKDIMHNLWHIELVDRWVNKIVSLGKYEIDDEALYFALYFHGFVYSDEEIIREWLELHDIKNIDKIIKIAWESQRPEEPKSLEGKILHDAHVLEGGKTYMVVKTLITGSVRGQTLLQTLDYLKNKSINSNKCYLPETMVMCSEMNDYAKRFVDELEAGIC